MKRLKVLLAVVLAVTFLVMPSVTLAYGDYCPFSEDGNHDFTETSTKSCSHPHEGSRECFCGARVYLDRSYMDDCETCRRELCKEGVHCYIANIRYNEGSYTSGYGECYCGERKYFNWDYYDKREEVYPGLIIAFDDLHELKHPHRVYDQYTGTYYDAACTFSSCGVCSLESDYYRICEKYELNKFVYGYDYYDIYEDEYADDDWYGYEDPYYSGYDDSWYEYEDTYYSGYDDDWYEYEEPDYSGTMMTGTNTKNQIIPDMMIAGTNMKTRIMMTMKSQFMTKMMTSMSGLIKLKTYLVRTK